MYMPQQVIAMKKINGKKRKAVVRRAVIVVEKRIPLSTNPNEDPCPSPLPTETKRRKAMCFAFANASLGCRCMAGKCQTYDKNACGVNGQTVYVRFSRRMQYRHLKRILHYDNNLNYF